MLTVSTVRRALANGEQATLLGKEVVAAFNHLRKEGLLQSIGNTDLETNFVRYIQDFLNLRSFKLSWDGQDRGQARMNQGTPQGSPLSPALWAIYAARVARRADQAIKDSLWDRTNLLADQ